MWFGDVGAMEYLLVGGLMVTLGAGELGDFIGELI